MISENDLWCFNNEDTKPFILGVGNFNIANYSDYEYTDEFMNVTRDSGYDLLIRNGSIILKDRRENLYPQMMTSALAQVLDADKTVEGTSEELKEKIPGLYCITLEMPGCFNSDVFGNVNADVRIKYHETTTGYTYTFYTTENSPITALELAEAYGGGGHKHAAGAHIESRETIFVK